MLAKLSRLTLSVIVIAPLLLGAGCSKKSGGDDPIPPEAQKEVHLIFLRQLFASLKLNT